MQQVEGSNGEYQYTKNDPELAQERVKEVRRAHFNFGNN